MKALLESAAGRSILVVGDVMLDHFVIGAVDRISPEAPVPVVRFTREAHRLGGAANVASNLRALGAQVEIVALTGRDAEAAHLRAELEAAGIGTGGLVADDGRCTTRKMRVVTTRNQQVARIDYETDTEAAGALEAQMVGQVERLAASAAAVVVSDYLKGAVSKGVAGAAIAAGRRRGIPVTIDPKVPHIGYYAGASLITPNHHEAEAVTHLRIRSDEEAGAAARRFREVAGCDAVLITRGEFGMWLHSAAGDVGLPAAAREVADVTGAGDTVVAAMTLALAGGASLEDAARLANRAAGIVVGRFGPATVRPDELL